jgi:two-component system NtrC family sensor kinase
MKKRIFAGLVLLLLIFAVGSVVVVLALHRTTAHMDRLLLLHQVELQRQSLIIHLQQVQTHLYRSRLQQSVEADLVIAHVQEMDRAMNSCLECHHRPELTQALMGMRDLADDYKRAVSQVITASANPGRIVQYERHALELGQELIAMAEGMTFAATVRLQKDTEGSTAVLRDVRSVLYVMLAAGFVLALLVAFGLARSVDRPVRSLLEATRRVARGDLGQEVSIPGSSGDAFRELGDAFNAMTRGLHQSRRQLVQSTKLAAIGELATNIAYEVNNPLTAVLGYIGLLTKSDDLPESKREHLKTIEREALRAREILKNLLDFARRKPPRPETTDIRDVLDAAASVVRPQAQLGGIQIVIDCQPGVPAVRVDPGEMKQVFVNLMNNAVSSMQRGGTLTVRCRREPNDIGPASAAVEVADTGAGIPEAYLERIFDPFFTTRADGGSPGLGLSISAMIVHHHGGRVEVSSAVGKGSVFTVILPADEMPA